MRPNLRPLLRLSLLAAVFNAPMPADWRPDIEFARVNGISLTLDASIPDGPGPFPAVIVVHGGGFINGDKQTYVKPLFEPLTRGGFAWFTINYRLAPTYQFPAAVEDLEAAIRYVRSHARDYRVDLDRIAIMGESAGGHLVSFVGTRIKPDTKIAAVVSFYGPHDFAARAQQFGEPTDTVQKFLGVGKNLAPETMKVLREASPITHVHAGMPPYLLIHGTKDASVPYSLSPAMCEKMTKSGNVCEVYTVADAPHGVGPWEKNPDWQGYKVKMVEWLKATMKTGR